MSDQGSRETRCGNCGRAIDEASDLPVEDRGPCDRCGSRSRRFHVELQSSITATSTVTARLTSRRGQIIHVGTATETEVAHQVSRVQGSERDRDTGLIAPEALPTEVIAECLRVGIKRSVCNRSAAPFV
jgi:DNA-directed RNA polymerase subunit RPC12/RpoP